MDKSEVLEQRRRVVQQQLECWSRVRTLVEARVAIDAGATYNLQSIQALEIAVNAEGRALEHVDAAHAD